jgi:hypothetical protein
VADEGHRLPRLVDLPGELEQARRAPHDVGGVAARNDQAVERVGLDLVYAGVYREGVAALALVALFAGSGDHRARPFFLEADLGVPELQVLVQGPGEEEDGLAGECHGYVVFRLRSLVVGLLLLAPYRCQR